MDDESFLLEQLSKRFPPAVHRTNPEGMTYIAVDAVIGRLNEATPYWDTHVQIVLGPTSEGVPTTRSGKPQFITAAVLSLYIPGLGTRVGAGSNTNFDADTSIKGAVSQALKKAAQQFGVGLYLADAEERAAMSLEMAAARPGASLQELKDAVFARAKRLDPAVNDGASCARALGVDITDLQDTDRLRAILAAADEGSNT